MSVRQEYCGYCGNYDPKVTQDHVIATALRGGRQHCKHPITIPACDDCQKKYDANVEYFRNCIVAMIDRNSHPVADRLLTEQVIRSVEKSRKACAELVRGFRRAPRFTKAGLYLGHQYSFQVEMNRLDSVIEKIIRGLYYYKSKVKFPDDYEIRVSHGNGFWDDPGVQRLISQMSPEEHQGVDVFSCRYVKDNTDPEVKAWLMIFYGQIGFFAWSQKVESQLARSLTPVLVNSQ